MMKINKMASIAIMIGGALINATAFVVGSYLAEYLSGDQIGLQLMTESRSRKNRILWTQIML